MLLLLLYCYTHSSDTTTPALSLFSKHIRGGRTQPSTPPPLYTLCLHKSTYKTCAHETMQRSSHIVPTPFTSTTHQPRRLPTAHPFMLPKSLNHMPRVINSASNASISMIYASDSPLTLFCPQESSTQPARREL